MATRESRYWLGLLSTLACLTLLPAAVESQCVVGTITPIYQYPNPTSPTFTRITKTLVPAANCPDPTGINKNAFGCGEIPSNAAATKLRASAYPASTPNPFCNWVCDCGPVTINTADGLPVELMDFSVEDEAASGAEGDADVAAEGGAAAHRAAAEAPREAAAP